MDSVPNIPTSAEGTSPSVVVSLDLLRWLSVQPDSTIRLALRDMAASPDGTVWPPVPWGEE